MNEAYYELSEILYHDYGWSDEDADEWARSSHVDKLTILNGRAGGVDFDEEVIPISMRFAQQTSDIIHLDMIRKCHVALPVDDEINLGRYPALLNSESHDQGKDRVPSSVYKRPTGWMYKGDKESYRCHTPSDVIDILEELHHACEEPFS